MQTTQLLRLATRLRVSMAALVALGTVGTFTESATRAMFVLPPTPAAAFVSVGEPAAASYSAGYLVGRRPAALRRGAQRSIPSTAPAGIVTEPAPVSIAALTPGNPVTDATPGTGPGLVTPEASPLAALRTIPTEARPGTFAGLPGQTAAATPDTPTPVVPDPTATPSPGTPTPVVPETPVTPTPVVPEPPVTRPPDTPPPAVPEPPAWMLALAGLGILAAFKYGKQHLLALKQDTALA